MPESQPCPNCGGMHEPGGCSSKTEKEGRVLSPEEQKEQEKTQKGLESCLSQGDIFNAEEIIAWAEEKNIPLDFTKPEIVSACQNELKSCLSQGDIFNAEEIIAWAEKKNIPLDFTKPEIVSACQKGLESCLSQGFISDAEEIIAWVEKKNIPLDFTKPEIVSACQKWLESCLSQRDISNAEKIIAWAEEKNISLDIAHACQNELKSCLSQRDISNAEKIIAWAEKKNIPLDFTKPEIVSACQKGLESCLSQGYIFNAAEIIAWAEKKNIPLDFASACQKGLESCLSQRDISNAEEIVAWAEKKNIPLDFTKPEIASACQKGLESCLSQGRIYYAEKNIAFAKAHGFAFSQDQIFTIVKPHLQVLFDKLGPIVPQLFSQAKKSPDLLLGLFAFKDDTDRFLQTLEADPFLAKTLVGNPHFSPHLLLKYPEFDDISKTKIRFLFEAKAAVLKDNPNLDPQSQKFRQAMQARLRSFDRNQEILQEADKACLDTKAFLDYAETGYFTLQSGDKAVSLSERLQAPITRLGETISSYAHQVKGVLAEYRDDLKQIQVSPDSVQETAQQIKDLENRLAEAQKQGDECRAKGMAKGLDGLHQKLAKIPQISLWEKLTSNLERCHILKESLNKNQEAILAAEEEYYQTLSDKTSSPQERLKLKAKIAQAKEEFTKSLAQLERRVNDFKIQLAQTLSPLGKERAEALVQEINEQVAEQFSHYETDLHTLNGFFSDKADKEKEKLEDRPMSIFVWARNPDIDLYQGNYSPCCICIDSEHMGAECTIADYATDLGIQIVNIWDEAKNEPVVAAWCWLGADENGKTALVVDNIEANNQFSSNFPTELWSQLKQYLEKYAKAVRADYLVLGKANNDLPTASELAKLPEAGSTYTKLGGENSRPDGYFLEAEGNTVKLFWEGKAKPKRVGKEKGRPKIELKDVNTQNLTQDDFKAIKALERKVYEEDIIRGQTMIDDLKEKNGLEYSVAIFGQRLNQTQQVILGYLVAYDDETDEGHSSVYLDDIAIAPDCQGQGFGWRLLQASIERLKIKAGKPGKQGKPILFDMHLRQTSQRLFEKHQEDLKNENVHLVESVLVPDYYDSGDDALYCVYEVKGE